MLFDIPYIADWKKFWENRQWLTDLSNTHENEGGIDMITKLVRKYFYGTMVPSAKQSPGIKKNHRRLCQSLWMEQAGFNAKTNLKG